MESSLATRMSICLASSSLIRSCQIAFCSFGLVGFNPASRVRLVGCKGSTAADPSRGRTAPASDCSPEVQKGFQSRRTLSTESMLDCIACVRTDLTIQAILGSYFLSDDKHGPLSRQLTSVKDALSQRGEDALHFQTGDDGSEHVWNAATVTHLHLTSTSDSLPRHHLLPLLP